VKLLITGGCGFLGSNLAEEAIKRGERIYIFDNLSRPGSAWNLEWLRGKGQFEFVHGDIRNAWDVEAAIGKFQPDAIFHLAGQVAMTTSIAYPRRDFEINAHGTLNVLEAVRLHSPSAVVIYSSTNKVYGDLEWIRYEEKETRYVAPKFPKGLDETIPLDFNSPYGCSKGAADQYMLDYARVYGLNTVVFRHSSMYGGRQFTTYDQGWIGWFCQQALAIRNGSLTEPFTISGSGKQVRDVLHADDMKRLYFLAFENIDRIRGQVFNIGGGIHNSLSLLELFAILNDLLDVRMVYRKLPPRESDQKIFVADIDKATQMIRWKPEVSAEKGVKKMIDWSLDQQHYFQTD